MLTFKQIEALYWTVRLGTFSASAQKLHTTQSAITKRIKDLENLALTYSGVEKAYAIQAGRELRVIVEADKVSDADSDKLSFEIAQKIQTEMTYPGQIKVTVIREKRAVNIAR